VYYEVEYEKPGVILGRLEEIEKSIDNELKVLKGLV
jgi:hypothetical protein